VLVDKVTARFGEDLKGRTSRCGAWPSSPTPTTCAKRPAATVVAELFARGATVTAYDPVAMDEARRILGDEPGLRYAEKPMDALEGADALVIVTEWKEFRSPDFDAIKAAEAAGDL
jgi:UDPglucose 6-dehydrogenase